MPLEFPLRGARLDLRPFTAADATAAHRVYGDAEVMRHVGEGEPASPEQTARMLAEYADHQARHGFAFWAVIERGTGELIGDAGLELTAQGVELGYTLARDRWGHGFATEAGRLCVEAADGPLGLRRLVALADVENPASAAVLDRLGFVEDQVVRAYGRQHRRFVRER
jgi:ribosomal-protein-alanine N-acetyltransferase